MLFCRVTTRAGEAWALGQVLASYVHPCLKSPSWSPWTVKHSATALKDMAMSAPHLQGGRTAGSSPVEMPLILSPALLPMRVCAFLQGKKFCQQAQVHRM